MQTNTDTVPRYPPAAHAPCAWLALQGTLFVLHTGIAWRLLPSELGFGSGSTCYRRLDPTAAMTTTMSARVSRARLLGR